MIRAVISVATWNLKFNSNPDRTLSYLGGDARETRGYEGRGRSRHD
jgi:hypothetical protein